MSTRRFDLTALPESRVAAARQAALPELRSAELRAAEPGAAEPVQAAALRRLGDGRLSRVGGALLRLQREHGNRYVQRVLGHARGRAGQVAQSPAVPGVQTKLVVGPAGDRYEREADQVAETVLRSLPGRSGAARGPEPTEPESAGPEPAGPESAERGPAISRKAAPGADPLAGTSVDAGSEAAIARARSGGAALDPAVRSEMESAFGRDFRAVRIHQGPAADRLNRRLQARAFTSGPDIFFSSGAYRPTSSDGQALLAHELTHVVQQGAAGWIGRAPDRPATGDRPAAGDPPAVTPGRGRAVQRAVLAIDGATDDKVSKRITRNCLTNLTSHKQIPTATGKQVQDYPAGDARGQVYGPGTARAVLADLTAGSSTIGPLETLYILGHGSTRKVADLTPGKLATGLATAFTGYPGTFTGAIKLVACYSASKFMDGKKKTAGTGETYASRLRTEFDTMSHATFRPRFVEGIQGISWVDEDTGQRVGYEVLGAKRGLLSPLEQVYDDTSLQKKWLAALQKNDPAERKRRMDDILKRAHKSFGVPVGTPRRMVGEPARERYLSTSALSDFTAAVTLLRSAASKEEKSPNRALAAAALDRMRLDWESLGTNERKSVRKSAVRAHSAYLKAFQDRRMTSKTRAEWTV
jgi:hypothetical protein